MMSTELVMGPLQARLILRSLVSAGNHAEFVSLQVFRHESNSMELTIRSCDDSGTSLSEFAFGSSYFDSFTCGGVISTTARGPSLFSARLLARLFKNVPPAKIMQIKLILSVDELELNFFWKHGLFSKRSLRSVTHPVDSTLPQFVSLVVDSSVPVLSFSPKYLQHLLQLFPESSTLWALTIHRKPGSSNTLIFTNAIPGVEAGTTVELTVSQSDLNRNGSYFSRALCMFPKIP